MESVHTGKRMSEEDVKRLLITPALERKWDRFHIAMEVCLTDGKVNIQGNIPTRGKRKKADYILYRRAHYPLAVVEAKDNAHSVSDGLQQAMQYAEMLDVPFAYSSNGSGFTEHDYLTGKERYLAMEDFPTAEELLARAASSGDRHEGLAAAEETEADRRLAQVRKQPYYSGAGVHSPRYYQSVAVNRTLDAIAAGRRRLLLVMATGTGKTYTAFQIVWRLLRSGLRHRVLYLADRNFLVDQSIQQDFAPLGSVVHKIDFSRDDRNGLTAYQVYFGLYQQLTGSDADGEEEDEHAPLSEKYKFFPPNFFDLIIVDECHRGSAKADSRWRCILEYFSSATQIGMTATPKETAEQSNIRYFGEPLFIYSLNQGIEDGFLAPFRVIEVQLNISDGWRPVKDQRDYFGNPIEDRIYNERDYDTNIVLTDRIREVAERITSYLRRTDPMARTIVFCADEEAADRMRTALVNANADMVQKYPDYVVRITGHDAVGKSKLKYFISTSAETPVIATTSKLLSTGLDCKMVKLIVLDKMINSMTEFKQIIGRGTRLRWEDGKTSFTVMDLRKVSRLFADPAWDGPVETVEPKPGPGPKPTPPKPQPGPGPNPPPEPELHAPKPVVHRDGCRVYVTLERVSVYDSEGKLLRTMDIMDYTRETVRGGVSSLQEFIRNWPEQQKQTALRELLEANGIDLATLKKDRGMEEVDDFDFLCYVAFGQAPLTRRARAEQVRRRDFFSRYAPEARQVLQALLEQYARVGSGELAKVDVLSIDPFRRMGSITKIFSFFGGRAEYFRAVQELQSAIIGTVPSRPAV